MAGRIFDDLSRHYGADDVFMDIDAIPFGMDFSEEIATALSHAKVLVVVIGTKWLGARDNGPARILDVTDPVRIELETAKSIGLPVLPVLVDGAEMPGPADLPESLERFSYRNACKVDSGVDFQTHMGRLKKALDGFVAAAGPVGVPAQAAGPQPSFRQAPQPPQRQPQPPPSYGPPPGYGGPQPGYAGQPAAAMPPHYASVAYAQPGPGIALPDELLRKWAWGPFFLWCFWPWWNADTTLKVLTGVAILASFIPFLGWFVAFGFGAYLGANGNRLMAANRRFASVEEFVAVQTAWARWGVITFAIGAVLGFFAIVIGAMSGSR